MARTLVARLARIRSDICFNCMRPRRFCTCGA